MFRLSHRWVPNNFEVSARLVIHLFVVGLMNMIVPSSISVPNLFTISRTLVINNLEFDHADIFDDLAAINVNFIISQNYQRMGVVYAEGCRLPNGTGRWSEKSCWLGCRDRSVCSGNMVCRSQDGLRCTTRDSCRAQ